jgi:hypothetical protein
MQRVLWWVGIGLFCLPSSYGQKPDFTAADLEGDVIDAITGKPIPEVRIKLENPKRDPIYLKADARGHFRISDLEPNFYWLSTRSPGYLDVPTCTTLEMRRVVNQVESCVHENTQATMTAVVTDGRLHVNLDVRLSAYAVVTGKLTDPYGTPLSQWRVEAVEKRLAASSGKENEPAYRVTSFTNDKGEYRIAPIKPGTYYLVAAAHALAEATYRETYYPGVIGAQNAKPLTLAAGQQISADIRIIQKSGVRVAGRLIQPAGSEDQAGGTHYTQIRLTQDEHDLGWFESSTHGDEYQIKDVLPGKYTLIATTSADPQGQKPLSGLIRSVEIGAQDQANLDLSLAPLREIAGKVTFHDGCPQIPVRISGYGTMLYGQIEAKSDSDGQFVLRGLTTSTYRLMLLAERGQTILPVDSMRLGSRDVLKDGLESPPAGDALLEIKAGCYPARPQ